MLCSSMSLESVWQGEGGGMNSAVWEVLLCNVLDSGIKFGMQKGSGIKAFLASGLTYQ